MKDNYRNKKTEVSIKDELLKNAKTYNKIYSTSPIVDEESLNMAVAKIKDHFDFLRYQIIMIGMKDNKGDIRYEYPVIVTKVHNPDVNCHNTYDYINYVRGNCEFISAQTEKDRYLWRFCTRSNIPNWFLEIVDKWVNDEDSGDKLTKNADKICFVENGQMFFPFKKNDDTKALEENNKE